MAGGIPRADPAEPAHRGRAGEVSLPAPVSSVMRTAWRGDETARGPRPIPEETPVALTYNRSAYAVMLATPADLEDFAVGFSLTEGIIEAARQVEELEVVEAAAGI